uniref:Uncharacterized protein n=1 Tax=Pinguiococcus pyrenoidosus TaxID=172671 RepID=A0A6U0U239_9STRA|mmetsp:Transcript_14678/g.55558  ORF Transcript_14678/g.55558 Transcript_14678/m.55558 type:complete len:217 (+) Transcript_14678:145-795(+)
MDVSLNEKTEASKLQEDLANKINDPALLMKLDQMAHFESLSSSRQKAKEISRLLKDIDLNVDMIDMNVELSEEQLRLQKTMRRAGVLIHVLLQADFHAKITWKYKALLAAGLSVALLLFPFGVTLDQPALAFVSLLLFFVVVPIIGVVMFTMALNKRGRAINKMDLTGKVFSIMWDGLPESIPGCAIDQEAAKAKPGPHTEVEVAVDDATSYSALL